MNKHALLMLVCCLVPLAIVGVVLASGASLGGLLPFAIMLLCPLMHILLMRGMGHNHAGHQQAPLSQDSPASSCHDSGRSAPAEPTRAGSGLSR